MEKIVNFQTFINYKINFYIINNFKETKMGNCVDKGDGGSGDHKGKGLAALIESPCEFSSKGDAGRVVCKILADKKFEISEFEGDGEEAKTSWKGDITTADDIITFDASAEGGTESDVKSFKPTLEESGKLKFDHKFIGDIEELDPVGEAAAAEEKKEE